MTCPFYINRRVTNLVEMERNIGYTTAIGEITRESGNVIGNSLKSIYSRITSIQPAIDAMANVGVSIEDMNGGLRDVDDILGDLGGKWHTLSREQQQNLGLQIAGRYQLSRFLILMENWDQALSATDSALHSSGSAMRENERYLDSYEAKINKVKNAWTESTMALQEDFLGDAILGFTTVATGFINTFTTVIDKVGLLPAVLGTAGVALSLFGVNVLKLSSKGLASLSSGLKSVGESIYLAGLEARSNAANMGLLSASMQGLGVTAKSLLRTLGPFAVLMAAGWGISKLVEKFVEAKQATEELEEAMKKTNESNISAVTENKERVDELIKSYESLSRNRPESGFDDIEKEQEYLNIMQELGELFPALVSHIDTKGQTHLKNADAIREEIKAANELAEVERVQIIEEAKDNYEERIDDLAKYQKEVESTRKSIVNINREIANAEVFVEDGTDLSGGENLEYWKGQLEKKEQELLLSQARVANISGEFSDDIATIFLTLGQTFGNEVIPEIQDAFLKVIGSINFDENTNIDEVTGKLFNFSRELDQLFDAGDSDGFSKKVEEINEYTAALENSEVGMAVFGTNINEFASSLDSSTGVMEFFNMNLEDMQKAIDKGISLKELAAQASDDLADSEHDLADAVDEVAEAYDNSISSIKDYNKMLDEIEDGGISAESIGLIIEKYDEFLPYIGNEIELQRVLGEAVKDERDIALQAIQDKLMVNEEYINFVVKDHQDFYNFLNKTYDVDLKNFKDLAEAKEAVENVLISRLAGKWGDYLQIVNGAVKLTQEGFNESIMMDEMATLNGNPDKDPKLNNFKNELRKQTDALQKEVDEAQKRFDSVTIDLSTADFSNIGRSISDAGKSASKAKKKSDKDTKHSTYVADNYKQALEMVNLELERQNSIQSKVAKHSKEYRDSLQKELKLLEQKRDLIRDQSNDLDRQIRSGYIAQTGVVTNTVASGVSGTGSTASGGGTQAVIWNYLSSKGFSDNIVAGIMGNLQMESGFDTSATNKSSGAFGLAQWLGSRKSSLQNYASSRGTSSSNLQTQLDFLWKELNSTEKRTLNWLKSNQNASASTVAAQFDRLFERSEGTHIPQRQKYANQILGRYSGSTSASTGSTIDTSDVSREIAQNAQNLDQAKSDLIGYELEILKLNDQIAEIPYQIVESHLDAFDHAMNQLESQMSRIDYYQNRYEDFTPEWSKYQFEREKLLGQQNKQYEDSIKFIEKEIKSNKSLTKEQRKRLDDQLIERQSELWNLESRILDERIKVANQLMNVYKDALSAQKDAALSAIDEMIKEIDDKEKEADYKRKLRNEQTDRQEILDEISQWALNDSDMAKKRVKELTEQLQEIDEVIGDMQHQKGLDDRKSALEDEKERIGNQYDDLINDEQAFADMRSNIIKGNTRTIEKELNTFYKKLGGMTEELGNSVVANLQRSIEQMSSYIGSPNFDRVKVPHFDTGGMARVKSSSGGLAVVHDKEQIFNPNDTRDLLKTVELAKSLFSHLKMPKQPQLATSGGTDNSTVYDIDFNIENMNGTQKDVDNLMKRVPINIRKRGGRM